MARLLVLWLTVGFLTCSHAATNLVINGDFETAALTPWTGSNAAIGTSGTNHNCQITGQLGYVQQLITTTPGTQYFLAADLSVDNAGYASLASVSVQAGAGGPTLGSRQGESLLSNRVSFVFTATTATTNVIFKVPNVAASTLTTTVDNVVVYELAPSTLAGRYSGRATTVESLPMPDTASLKFSAPLDARVTTEGLLFIVGAGPTGLTAAGVILNDGTLELTGESAGVTATIKGHRITFTIPGFGGSPTYALTGADASNTAPGTVSFPTPTQTYVLTRVGK